MPERGRLVFLPRKSIQIMRYFCFLVIAAGIAAAQVAPPSDPGMYVQNGSGYTKVIGQIAQFTRTGSKLASTATFGIKSAKANVQLQGAHAQAVVFSQPTFYFIPPKQAAEAGVNAGDLILIRLEEKPQRRQFEIAAAGLFRASAGISLTHQIQLLRSEPKPGVYVIMPATELHQGEYALYLSRGEGMAAYVYDFGVQDLHSGQDSLQTNRQQRTAETTTGNSIHPEDHESLVATPRAESLPSNPKAISSRGSLGVLGSDWRESGVAGVEILSVLDGSSAELAGLHKEDVITDINGMRIGSSQQLTNILSQMGPGTRVSIGYMFKSSIGWMPKSVVIVLSREQ